MSEFIWSFKELARFTRWEEPEVRFWAIDRLIRHFPEESCDVIADFVMEDHEVTPGAVARHLGEYGGSQHHAILVKGFRLLRGLTPGLCLQALARLGYSATVDLAESALERGDLTEPAQAIIIESLSVLGSESANEVIRRYVARRPELLLDPTALHGILAVSGAPQIPEILHRFFDTVEQRGTHRAGEAFRTLMDVLQVDDASWCFRTGPSGRIELRKTIKAVESGYDCDILAALGDATLRQLSQRFRAGNLEDIARSLADWTRAAIERLPRDPEDDLRAKIAATVDAFSSQRILERSGALGHQLQQSVLGFLMSAAFAVARYRNVELSLRRARGDLDRLLSLAEVETAFLLPELPPAIAVVCREDEDNGRIALDWCLRMLESQGPFFPKVVALETLGELRAYHFIPEIVAFLSDENSYVYGAAERALSKMGEAIVPPTAAKIESGNVDPDAAHSLLVLLCDLGTRGAYETVLGNLEWFMQEVGPGPTAEWISMFGTDDLIEPLRDCLEEDPALIGQSLLLLAAIHNVRLPEEQDILRAIEDERARESREMEEGERAENAELDDGDYVM